MIKKNKHDNILSSVSKPSRYIGKEWNAISSDNKKNPLRFLLAFPDTYEIGMSHLGMRILYNLLNKETDIRAERVFAPARDYTEQLKKRNLSILSLETETPICEFDIIGFSLQYELGYTNVLNVLSCGNIPLRSKDRTDKDPFVLAGGPCVFNPEPMAYFFDAYLIGDAENTAIEVSRVIKTSKLKNCARQDILIKLSKISGVYVPSLYDTELDEKTGKLVVKQGDAPYPIRRRIEFDLDKFPYPLSFPVPYCEAVHDRINVEVSRGCNSGCRFCQAGIIYRPNRPRNPNTIIDIIMSNLKGTGYDEISLTSLDLSSYPNLDGFIGCVMDKLRDNKISLSIPSVRTTAISENIAKQIQSVRKTGFTIAPEAGTQHLRDVINKNISEKDILDAVGFAFSQGWQLIKLYFMIGLPTETDEDIEAIFELSCRLSKIGKNISRKSGNINVSISTFVPKPHTPFQWLPMLRREDIIAKQNRLLDLIKPRKSIKLKWHDANSSYLEAIMSRGDRRIGDVIEHAFLNGACMDAWTDELRFEIWEKSFIELGIDPESYLYKPYSLDDKLPWSHIDTGVKTDFLREEYEKAFKAELTYPCGKKRCYNCGVCTQEFLIKNDFVGLLDSPDSTPEIDKNNEQDRKFYSYMGFFKKVGALKILSNRELINTIIRAFRRAGIAMNHSYGFNPHPRFSFGPALSVGMQALREPFQFELLDKLIEPDIERMVNEKLPEELRIFDIVYYDKPPKMHKLIINAVYKIPHDLSDDEICIVNDKIKNEFLKKEILFERTVKGGKIKSVDLKKGIVNIQIKRNIICLELIHPTRPQDVLDLFFGDKVDKYEIIREKFYVPENSE